jgi:type IV pilus assembly protein PilX
MFKRFPKNKQSGVVLVTALILLVVMTLLGIAGIRLVTQEERMTGYAYDRGLTFQASEAALRQAETAIELIKPEPTAAGCIDATSGVESLRICSAPNPADAPRWTSATFANWANATTVGTGTLAITPQYFAEYLGNSFPCGFDPTSTPVCKRYRITARAGGNGRAAAMVQSIYATD